MFLDMFFFQVGEYSAVEFDAEMSFLQYSFRGDLYDCVMRALAFGASEKFLKSKPAGHRIADWVGHFLQVYLVAN